MSNVPKIFESEYRFCLILWENEPIASKELVRICKEKLDWSRTTTYTVIERLAERGVLVQDHTAIRSLVSKDDVQLADLDEFFEKRFEGSLPAFVAAFARHQNLTDDELNEIRRIIQHGDR